METGSSLATSSGAAEDKENVVDSFEPSVKEIVALRRKKSSIDFGADDRLSTQLVPRLALRRGSAPTPALARRHSSLRLATGVKGEGVATPPSGVEGPALRRRGSLPYESAARQRLLPPAELPPVNENGVVFYWPPLFNDQNRFVF